MRMSAMRMPKLIAAPLAKFDGTDSCKDNEYTKTTVPVIMKRTMKAGGRIFRVTS